jgi:hypothetical protein
MTGRLFPIGQRAVATLPSENRVRTRNKSSAVTAGEVIVNQVINDCRDRCLEHLLVGRFAAALSHPIIILALPGFVWVT